MDEEKWAIIPEFDGQYEVSSHGRVREVGGRIMPPYWHCGGYAVTLVVSHAARRRVIRRRVVRLVAEAFCPNVNNWRWALHIDGDRDNNHYTNIFWSPTRSGAEKKPSVPKKPRKEKPPKPPEPPSLAECAQAAYDHFWGRM